MNSKQYRRIVHSLRQLGLPIPTREQLAITAKQKPKTKQSAKQERLGNRNSERSEKRYSLLVAAKTVGIVVAMISLVASCYTLQQFWYGAPDISPINYDTYPRFRGELLVTNQMSVSMYHVEIGSYGGMFGYGNPDSAGHEEQDWESQARKEAAADCQMLIGSGDIGDPVRDNLVINEDVYNSIGPGEKVRLKSGWVLGIPPAGSPLVSHSLLTVGLIYRVKIFGFIPTPKRVICRNYETETDLDGRVHLVPFKPPNAVRGPVDTGEREGNATKESTNTDQRAYISISNLSFGTGQTLVELPMVNNGRIPSGTATFEVHEETAVVGVETVNDTLIDEIIEAHRQHGIIASLPPGQAYSIHVLAPKLDRISLKSGREKVAFAGILSYNDGVPHTPEVKWPFCGIVAFDKASGRVGVGTCDPTRLIAQIKQQEKYPESEYSDIQ